MTVVYISGFRLGGRNDGRKLAAMAGKLGVSNEASQAEYEWLEIF
jgi:hypothetical protein